MTALAMPEWSLLGAHLAPVADLMNDAAVSEIALNRPGEIWIERAGSAVMERRDQPEFTADKLLLLANAVAARSNQRISPETPLLSARLPGGERIQLVAAPVIEAGVALAIRRQVMRRFSLNDYEGTGFFERAGIVSASDLSEEDKALAALLKAGEMRAFLETAVRARKNIVVSGGTSSGKTTFANALIGAIPVGERLVTIEDARELDPPHKNTLAMVASRGGQGRAKVDATQLLEASLRLRPDRILLGELRGAEAYSWIRAVNTGHPGSITTVHADTPGGALDQIAFMVMQSGVGLGFEPVKAYVRSVVDIIIQLRRVDGARRIDGIWHRASEMS